MLVFFLSMWFYIPALVCNSPMFVHTDQAVVVSQEEDEKLPTTGPVLQSGVDLVIYTAILPDGIEEGQALTLFLV